MENVSTKEYAAAHGLSERTVRNYCAQGKIAGARLVGRSWTLPEDAPMPGRINGRKRESGLLHALREERAAGLHGGIYHKTQVELTYNSNHIEGSRLSKEQTRFIFETNTVGVEDGNALNVDDIIETTNHFKCVDYVIEHADEPLTESMIKRLHGILKAGTSDERRDWFNVGGYKRLANEVGGMETTRPKDVGRAMRELLRDYRELKSVAIEDIIGFHWRFGRIHPFQDGNGRVGRLVMFKECLRWRVVPFIIRDEVKMFYYRGLQEWEHVRGYLLDTCLSAQDEYRNVMSYFGIND